MHTHAQQRDITAVNCPSCCLAGATLSRSGGGKEALQQFANSQQAARQ